MDDRRLRLRRVRILTGGVERYKEIPPLVRCRRLPGERARRIPRCRGENGIVTGWERGEIRNKRRDRAAVCWRNLYVHESRVEVLGNDDTRREDSRRRTGRGREPIVVGPPRSESVRVVELGPVAARAVRGRMIGGHRGARGEIKARIAGRYFHVECSKPV